MFSAFAAHTLLLNVYSIDYNKVKSFFTSTPIFIFLKASVHKWWKHNHKLIMATFSVFLSLPLKTLLLSNQCQILLHNILPLSVCCFQCKQDNLCIILAKNGLICLILDIFPSQCQKEFLKIQLILIQNEWEIILSQKFSS